MNAPHPSLDKYIRPSSLQAISLCAGRPTLEAHVVALDGEPESTEVASLGHELHAYADNAVAAVKEGMGWGEAIADVCNHATSMGVDSWSVWCLQDALEKVRDLVLKHGIELDNILTEHRLDMASLGFAQGGTADVVLVVPGVLVIVIDYKFGFIDQGTADEHDQLQAYAAAAAETFTAPDVIVALIQPRADRDNRISQARFDADTLRKNRVWTAAVIRLARGDNPQLTGGFTQCQHCRALPRCPEARRFIMQAKEALETIGDPLDADGRGALADAAKLAEKFTETGKGIAKAALQKGEKVTGWKLGTPRAMRSVADPGGAIDILAENGITVADLAKMEALTFKVGALTPPALALIESHVTEKLSDPPLTQDKKGRG